MIRKAIIVVLTLAAVMVAVHWWDSEGLGLPGRIWGFPGDFRVGPASPRSVNLYVDDAQLHIEYGSMVRNELCSARRTVDAGPFLGFRWWTSCLGNCWCSHVDMPIVFVLSLLLAYPSVAFVRGAMRRWRRRRRGLCLKCGYDLTGNESGVCSECGTGISE
jgi:hypothetical protein